MLADSAAIAAVPRLASRPVGFKADWIKLRLHIIVRTSQRDFLPRLPWVELEEIMVAFTAGESPALGNIWRITAKKTDFYLDPLGEPGRVAHLSVHGANERFDGHRFHIKVDRRLAAEAKDQGHFVGNGIPRNGFVFDGQQLSGHVFLVARIRWSWDLQRPRFRTAAVSGSAPELAGHQSGARLSDALLPNEAWDLDLVVSYGQPYWPNPHGSLRDNARLGPLPNDAGLWLTATSYHRSKTEYPTPERLSPRLPHPGEEPNRILCCGPGSAGVRDMFWFVETITSRQLIEASIAGHEEMG
jgi:hypothetical protein